eukprot:3412452-Amphidinium_carterae.1
MQCIPSNAVLELLGWTLGCLVPTFGRFVCKSCSDSEKSGDAQSRRVAWACAVAAEVAVTKKRCTSGDACSMRQKKIVWKVTYQIQAEVSSMFPRDSGPGVDVTSCGCVG